MHPKIDLPKLNHSEVSAFYEYALSIPKEKVLAILELPRKTLIEDMETILMDIIERFEYFQSIPDDEVWHSFQFHSLFVLIELKATEALPIVLELLKQSDDFISYWYSDYATEDLWEVLYHLSGAQLEVFNTILLSPGDWIPRSVAGSMAEQIYLHHPERRTEIIEWYRFLFNAFITMDEKDPALNRNHIESLVGDVISIKTEELLPLIKILSEKDLIRENFMGDYDFIESELKTHEYPLDTFKRDLKPSIFDRYKDAMTWYGYEERYNKDGSKKEELPLINSQNTPLPSFSKKTIVETFKRKGEKISRNAPCPCGSGKKYKKCCLKK